jgi:hypothetical protein
MKKLSLLSILFCSSLLLASTQKSAKKELIKPLKDLKLSTLKRYLKQKQTALNSEHSDKNRWHTKKFYRNPEKANQLESSVYALQDEISRRDNFGKRRTIKEQLLHDPLAFPEMRLAALSSIMIACVKTVGVVLSCIP